MVAQSLHSVCVGAKGRGEVLFCVFFGVWYGAAMMKRTFLLGVLLWSVSVLPAQGFDLTILHVNDSHSYLDSTRDTMTPDGEKVLAELGGWPRLATLVNRVRRQQKNVALLHAGDAVQGGLYFMKFSGEPEMRFLNRLGFDAMVLGNHEFDKGADFLARFLEYAQIPILGANVRAPGIPRLSQRLKPYVILHYGGERVGVIGLTTKDTRFISSPGPGVTFEDEAATARARVRELEAMGIDKIILLTHVGLENDRKLAAEVPGVDVIVGGHSHSLLGDSGPMRQLGLNVAGAYPITVKGADGNDVLVVTAWKWARILGRLEVTFDGAGHVTKAVGRPVLLVADRFRQRDAKGAEVVLAGADRSRVLGVLAESGVAEVVPKDGPSVAFLAPYSQGVKALRQMVIGQAVSDIPHIRVPGVTSSGVNLPDGSLLAPLVARAMLDKLAETDRPADIALLNGGGVRESVHQGPISVGTAYALMPFGNTLFVLDVTGEQFREALEHGVTRGGGAFPYVAGARYSADMNRPKGQRITRVKVWQDGRWQELEPGRTYRLVTNTYLARGGDGYAMLKGAGYRYDTGFVAAQIFIEYVKRHKRLSPPQSTGVTYLPAK